MKKIILIIFIFSGFAAFSQQNNPGNSSAGDDKYFESGADTLHLKVSKITVSQYGDIDSSGIDTLQRHIELYEDYEKDFLPYINLGQTGTPSMPMIFMLRKEFEPFMFLNPYEKYLEDAKNFAYYKTNAPYTNFKYMGGTKLKEEQFLDAIHTQTPTKFINWGLRFKMLTPPDLADPSKTSGINLLSAWYHRQIKAYQFYFGISSFKIRRIENGGILDTAAGFEPYDKTNIFYLNNDVNNHIRYNNIFFRQTYNLSYRYTVGHSLKYTTFKKIFDEKSPNTSFFGPTHITNALSYDSTGVRSIDNSLFFNWHEKGNITFSYTNSLKRYYYFRGFLYNLKGEFVADNYFNISFDKIKFNKLQIDGFGQFHFTNRNAGDIKIYAKSQYYFNENKLNSISVSTGFDRHTPDYFYDNYNGNYKYWKNDFNTCSEFFATAEINANTLNLKLGGNFQRFKNYIYFDKNALPAQDTNSFTVETAWLRKSFRFKPFVLDLNLYYQYSNADSILHIPQYVASASFYMDFGVAKDAMHLNMGANIYYYSQFYTYSYAPSIGMFYLSNDRISGNYPILNLFLSARIKSAILIFRFDNAAGWLLSPYHETVEHYHIQDFFFRMGVQWWFKN